MALIAWYKLDGNANDSSGNGRNGSVAGVLSYTTGKIGQCGNFDGINDYVVGTYSAPSPHINFSMSCWFKAPTQTIASGLVSFGYYPIIQMLANGTLSAWWYDGTTYPHLNSSLSYSDNLWHHAALVRNNTAMYLYVDGAVVAQNLNMTVSVIHGNLEIGREKNNGDKLFTGLIDDVRYYNHALSSKEIKLLSQAKVLHYDFDDFQEPTTNLETNFTSAIFTSCYNGTNYGFGAGTDLQQVALSSSTGCVITKVSRMTGGTSQADYVHHAAIGLSSNEIKTLSFMYYGTVGTSIRIYGNSPGTSTLYYLDSTGAWVAGGTGAVNVPVTANVWQKITIKMVNTGTAGSEVIGWMVMHYDNTPTTLTNAEYWMFTDWMIEARDHATPFVNGSRTGLVKDISGYGFNATLTANSPAWKSDVVSEGLGSYYFKGSWTTSTVNFTSTAITVAFWVNASSYSTVIPLSLDGTSYSSGPNVFFYNNVVCWNTGDGAGNPFSNSSYPSTNVWHHIAVTDNGSVATLYVDGLYVGTATAKVPAFSDLWLGRYHGDLNYNLIGYLDDVRIYATALSAADILEIYQTKANLDNVGNLSTHMLTSTWAKTANEYKALNPAATSGTYNIRPNGVSAPIQAYCDMSTMTHDNQTGWTLVGSWDDAPEWTKSSITSSDAFLTTAKNCVSSNFGNTVIHAFRILISNDITQTGSNAVADWYYYWINGTTWKAVWSPDGRKYEYWRSSFPRYSLRPFDFSYNLKFSYMNTSHKINNLSDYGIDGVATSDGKGLVGSGASYTSTSGYSYFWRALTNPGYKFGVYNLSYTGDYEAGNSPTADGTLGITIQNSTYGFTGQDAETDISVKVGYDDTGLRAMAGTTATDVTTNSLADNVKMWWFIL